MYTAAVIDPLSAGLLRWISKSYRLSDFGFDFKTPQNTAIPHHMTINLGALDVNLNPEEILGQPAEIHVNHIRWCQHIGACAAGVIKAQVEMKEWPAKYWQDIETINEHPHITISLMNGIKPFVSNQLFESASVHVEHLDEVYVLKAVIEECA